MNSCRALPTFLSELAEIRYRAPPHNSVQRCDFPEDRNG